MTQIEPSSLLIGCRPPARSTIDSRRAPSATPGSIWICSSSGPRCAIAPVIASSRPAENSRRPFRSIAPAMPHMVILPRNDFSHQSSPPIATVARSLRSSLNYITPARVDHGLRTPGDVKPEVQHLARRNRPSKLSYSGPS